MMIIKLTKVAAAAAILTCSLVLAAQQNDPAFDPCNTQDYNSFNQDQCCQYILDVKNKQGKDKTTIVVLGATGTGKSTQANAIFGQELFKTSSSLESCTQSTEIKIAAVKMCLDVKFKNANQLKIVDTPGLQDSENRDTEHVKDMVDSIKALKYVNQFQIFFNSQDVRFGNNQNQALQIIEDNFSKDFWLNAVIIFTRWSNQQHAIDMREKQGLYRETVEESIKTLLHKRFPASKKSKLPVFFTDVFEMEQDFEKTTLELSKLIHHAKVSPFFDTTNFEISSFFGWREEKDFIQKKVESHRKLIKSNSTWYFFAGETIFNERIFKQISFHIEDDNSAKKLNKNDYEQLKYTVEQIASKVKQESIEKEKFINDNGIKAVLVVLFTGIAIKLSQGKDDKKKVVKRE